MQPFCWWHRERPCFDLHGILVLLSSAGIYSSETMEENCAIPLSWRDVWIWLLTARYCQICDDNIITHLAIRSVFLLFFHRTALTSHWKLLLCFTVMSPHGSAVRWRQSANYFLTWENDAFHPRVGFQKLCSSQRILEMPLHPQVQRLQSSVAQEAVKGRRNTTEGWQMTKSAKYFLKRSTVKTRDRKCRLMNHHI